MDAKYGNKTKGVMSELAFSQLNLGHTYESTKARMKAHPERAEKDTEIVKGCPHFKTGKEAVQFASTMSESKSFGLVKVWATIEKDEEFYRIGAPWVVSVGAQHLAAEYIGLYFVCDVDDQTWSALISS